MGDTVVLVTVVANEPRESTDFFPLRGDYEEKLYAGGFIRGARFAKREGPPSDEAIVAARLIDHAIRPLFPKDYLDEVQVTVTVLSVDGENDPQILSFIATSAALHASDIPWTGPVAAVRLGLKDGAFVINPPENHEDELELNAVISSINGRILSIEAESQEVPEEKLLEGIKFCQEPLSVLASFIDDFANEVGKKKYTYEPAVLSEELLKNVSDFAGKKIKEIVVTPMDKVDFVDTYNNLLEEIYTKFEGKYTKQDMKRALDEVEKKEIQKLIFDAGKRVDGRGLDEIRPLEIEVGLLPRTHGSAFFARGMTQALSIVTLGSSSLEQLIQSMTGEETKRYMHHYYGQPFSLGETGPIRAPGRREIGHGMLAEKALRPMIPDKETFPYAIRVVTEVLSQNGSTSMASTCGSSLALMDAGVPIKAPVAGLSIGLMTDLPEADPPEADSPEADSAEEPKYILLVDIVGVEDNNGYMDFKIAGTRRGITAIQMELKMHGIPFELMEQAMLKSREKRLEILEMMGKAISKPREQLSKYAPRITVLKIDPKRIGEVIGPGGKVIKSIIEATGCEIDIEEDGTVLISSTEGADPQRAKDWVEGIVREVKVGEIYEGTVKRIMDFGAFVEILPQKEGMVHISELAHTHTRRVEDVVKVGDKIKVRVIEIDPAGRINLSVKALQRRPPMPRPRRPSLGYRTPYYQRPGYRSR
jgi:polyribonucleotide nucleotidyltransferase